MADYGNMRRADREILNFSEIVDVLRRGDVFRLGINGDPYPYVVPLSYGFEALDYMNDGRGGIVLYIHGAAEGLKHELIAKNNHVCVEFDIFHGSLVHGEGIDRSITSEYESVIGFGTIELIKGADAEKGVSLLLDHAGHSDFSYDKAILNYIKVYKITLTDIKGKRNIL